MGTREIRSRWILLAGLLPLAVLAQEPAPAASPVTPAAPVVEKKPPPAAPAVIEKPKPAVAATPKPAEPPKPAPVEKPRPAPVEKPRAPEPRTVTPPPPATGGKAAEDRDGIHETGPAPLGGRDRGMPWSGWLLAFAMLIIGFAAGFAVRHQMSRRKLGGMTVRIGTWRGFP